MTASNILLISHGHRVKDAKDRFIHLTDVAMDNFSHLTTPGAFLADVFPIRKRFKNFTVVKRSNCSL